MTKGIWAILGAIALVWVSQIGMIWTVHRDLADLRERMAKIEGSVDEFSKWARLMIDRMDERIDRFASKDD